LLLKGTAVLLLSAPVPAALHVAAAQETNLQLPISVDADFFNYDGKTSMLTYRGLKLTQGNIGIQADIGRGSSLDFEDSVWEFSGNVLIEVQDGHIECDSANLKFAGYQLQWAEIKGAPATFEMQRPESDAVTYAEAGKLQYDFANGVVEFSDNARISEGGNQISSNYLVYDIKEQRINAQSEGEGKPKVKIIYTPQDSANPQTDDQDSSEENEESQDPNDGDGRR
jgi:lipopolysaccharide transport protein LptA